MTQVFLVFGLETGRPAHWRTPASTSAPGAVVEEMEIEDPMNEAAADAADLEEEQT